MGFKEKLLSIQLELKAPKGQYNDHGNYKYRSCEDILEAVKPLLKEYNLLLEIRDHIEQIGDRYYIKAEITLEDIETEAAIITYGYAREVSERKGMDASQITGTASSYARKYALNALFLIDDTKDADTNELAKETEEPKASDKQVQLIASISKDINSILDYYNVEQLSDLTKAQASDVIKALKGGK